MNQEKGEESGSGMQEHTPAVEHESRNPPATGEESLQPSETQAMLTEEQMKFPSGSLMDIFFNRCFVKDDGWWTYELCHGRNVTQFRRVVNEAGVQLRVQGSLLGVWLPTEGSEQEQVHHYVQGTPCGVGAQPREARVYFR